MAQNKERDDPSTTSAAWRRMAPKWRRIDALVGGTATMRAASQEYLPMHSSESTENYQKRLDVTTLYNMTGLTLDTLVGKPFSDPVELNDDVPESVKALEGDIDMQGNSMSIVARDWFRMGMKKGFAQVMVDMPAMTEEDREGRTKADDLAENRRPFWTVIDPENVIFSHSKVVDGREVLLHVRILEEVIDMDGFAEVTKQRIRVLEPGTFAVYELQKLKGKRKETWELIESGTTSLDEIPIVTYYADRTGHMEGKPPLEDLSFLNVRHWQSTSDQVNILTVARFPMLAVAGAIDGQGASVSIGPRQLLGTRDPAGRYYYVEHSGKAIASGRDDIQDLEQQMSAYGAEFLRRTPNGQTATSSALNSAESMSGLQDHVIRFEETMAQALRLTALWLKEDEGGSVTIKKEFHDGEKTQALKALLDARANGDLSLEDFLSELRLLGFLSDEFDMKENLARLKLEMAAADIRADKLNENDFKESKKAPEGEPNDGEVGDAQEE